MSKPKAVPESLVCSECGLDWGLHPENPRRRDCIKLLKEHYERIIAPPRDWWTFYSDTTGNYSGLITLVPNDDDPDMGVQAKVS